MMGQRGNCGRGPTGEYDSPANSRAELREEMNQSKDAAAQAALQRVAADLLDEIRHRAEHIGQAVSAAKSAKYCSEEQAAWLDLQADLALTELRWVRARILAHQAASGDLRRS